jgi:hypothetical protein
MLVVHTLTAFVSSSSHLRSVRFAMNTDVSLQSHALCSVEDFDWQTKFIQPLGGAKFVGRWEGDWLTFHEAFSMHHVTVSFTYVMSRLSSLWLTCMRVYHFQRRSADVSS